ncbi:hypothetical protein F5B19DRAFT_449106 [Rostrohypoxylon terebratum]|nr:hypothetical protein F5B19DRAFT_449106 [Rostrohypoxylon terebratum]
MYVTFLSLSTLPFLHVKGEWAVQLLAPYNPSCSVAQSYMNLQLEKKPRVTVPHDRPSSAHRLKLEKNSVIELRQLLLTPSPLIVYPHALAN